MYGVTLCRRKARRTKFATQGFHHSCKIHPQLGRVSARTFQLTTPRSQPERSNTANGYTAPLIAGTKRKNLIVRIQTAKSDSQNLALTTVEVSPWPLHTARPRDSGTEPVAPACSARIRQHARRPFSLAQHNGNAEHARVEQWWPRDKHGGGDRDMALPRRKVAPVHARIVQHRV